MNNVEFNTLNGNVLVDTCVIAPLDLDKFLALTNQSQIKVQDCTRNDGWPSYGLNVKFNGQDFWMNISFKQKDLYSVWLSWNGGNVARKGYDSTEKELITDKNTLTKMLAKIVGKQPEVQEYNHDVFLFNWGYISTAASLQAVMTTIGISWQSYNG